MLTYVSRETLGGAAAGLTALAGRRALLAEGADPLLVVLGADRHRLADALQDTPRVGVDAVAGVHDRLGEPHRRVVKPGDRHHAGHQPDAERLLGVDGDLERLERVALDDVVSLVDRWVLLIVTVAIACRAAGRGPVRG